MVIWGHYSTIQYTKIWFGKFGYFVHNTELCQTVLLTAGTSTAFDTLPSPSEQDFFMYLCVLIFLRGKIALSQTVETHAHFSFVNTILGS